MPEHTLGPGRLIISALVELGEALGYTVVQEHPLPTGTAAVDVAWLRGPDGVDPLLVFEVESRPSAGLASNAMKVLGRSATDAMKPLHLFHVVVRGGTRSERPVDVAREFAGHNYTVHLLAALDEPRQLLEAVLRVHRRVADRLDGVALARAVARPPWPRDVLEPLLQYAEALDIAGLSERAYVLLARESPAFEPSLGRKLAELWRQQLSGAADPPNRCLESNQPDDAPYGSYMAATAGEALELGLLAALTPDEGERAFAVLERWQEFNHIGDRVGPYTGAGSQWTEYAVGHLGFMWALVGALMNDVPGARAWCAAQSARLLEQVYNGDSPDIALLAAWVMHLSAGVAGCELAYERARARLERDGGLTLRWLTRPEPAAPAADGDWDGVMAEGRDGLAPEASQLLALVRDHGAEPKDAVVLALYALLEDPVYRPWDGGALVAVLARGSSALRRAHPSPSVQTGISADLRTPEPAHEKPPRP